MPAQSQHSLRHFPVPSTGQVNPTEHNKHIELRIKKLEFTEAETARNSTAGQQSGGGCREKDRETQRSAEGPVDMHLSADWHMCGMESHKAKRERERERMKLKSNKLTPSCNTHKAGNSLCFFQPE